MRSYKKLSWLITPAIQRFDKILTQSQVNQDNYLTMGANENSCKLSGNLKFDVSLNNETKSKQQALNNLLPAVKKVWLIASTHPGDETLALKAFEKIRKKIPEALLIIVPRHPERFEQVAKLAREAGNNVLQRSQNIPVTPDTHVWVIDTLGELLAACSLADVVTMGGSFSSIGGHNPLEPALFKKPVIVGPNMSNFIEILAQLKTAQGIIQLLENNNMAQALSDEVLRLFTDETSAKALGNHSYQVVLANQGATEQSLAALQTLIKR